MDSHRAENKLLDEWKYTLFGLIIGVILTGLSQFVIPFVLESPPLEMTILVFGFIMMGLTIGLLAPESRLMIRLLSGIWLSLILFGLFYLEGSWSGNEAYRDIVGIGLGYILFHVGIWIGQQIQVRDNSGKNLLQIVYDHQKRIAIAVSVGLGINLLFFFVLSPLFKIQNDVTPVIFLLSFILTGYIIGWYASGAFFPLLTVCGIIAALFTGTLLFLFTGTPGELLYAFSVLALGFLLVFLGGWLSEKFRPLFKK